MTITDYINNIHIVCLQHEYGIFPDVPFADPSFHKDLFGVESDIALLSFGLLSANKAIETVITGELWV